MNCSPLVSLVVLFVIILVFAGRAQALMPPHVASTEPENGGVLETDTFVIHGYTLSLQDIEEPVVADLENGKTVDTEASIKCEWEGEGDMPGAKQEACTVWVRLLEPEKGHAYELRFLDEVFTFTYSPAGE